MADENLKEFYLRAGQPLVALNQWRMALAVRNQKLAGEVAADFCAAMSSWIPTIEAADQYAKEEREHRIAYGVWNHSGRSGSPPPEAKWPAEIPEYFGAMHIVQTFSYLLESAKSWDCILYEENVVGSELDMLIFELDSLNRLIEAPEEDQSDGPIDRNKLAAILGIQPKTLANRAGELPEPIARNAKGAPIYMYMAARQCLLKMYPDKAFMLPKFEELAESK